MRRMTLPCWTSIRYRSSSFRPVAGVLGLWVTLGHPTRTLAQNAAQWPILEAFARQVQVDTGNGKEFVDPEDWKNILTATFRGEAGRVARWQGRLILLGARTAKMNTKEVSEGLEFLNAAAAEQGVDLTWEER